MRTLVTGACGFVGRYLVDHLLASGDEVLATTFNTSHAPLRCRTCALDVADANACAEIMSAYRPEVIYHLAGIAFVPEAEENFQRALAANVGGTNNIIRPCHLLGLGTVIVFISSAEVYGRISPNDLPLTEQITPRPANNYSLSKAMAEMVVHRYVQFGKVRSVIFRPFNHIGAGQDRRFVASTIAEQLALIAKGKAAPHIKLGNLEAKRDFSDVRDIVRAYRLGALYTQNTAALTPLENSRAHLYNVGGGRSYQIKEILETLLAISGLQVRIDQDPERMRTAEVPEVFGSFAKAQRELGWQPCFSLRQSLEEVYRDWLTRV